MTTSVLVIGSTGRTGRRVVQALLDRGVEVRAASRKPTESPQVDAVRFDWSDPESFRPAVAGVKAIYQVIDALAEDPATQVRSLIASAEQEGVERIVHLSNTTAHLHADASAMGEVEQVVSASPIPWTILRPNVFHENFTENPIFVQGVRDGVIAVPAGDGRVAPVSVADIAAVAAVALCDEGHQGQAYSVTGPESLSFADLTRTVSEAAGRALRYDAIDPEEFLDRFLAAGFPAHVADFYAAMYGDIRRGWASAVSDDVARITGREPISFRRYAVDSEWN
jgi:uncharacterized protein YbjT (DUF2867 family)